MTNKDKNEQRAELSEDVARWLAKGNEVKTVDHTANAAWIADRYRRINGRSANTARAEIARNNRGFFSAHKKGAP